MTLNASGRASLGQYKETAVSSKLQKPIKRETVGEKNSF